MTTEETEKVAPIDALFLNSHHLLIAVVATIAAEHGIQATRELLDNLAEDEATWTAIAEKLGVAGADENAIDTEPPPAPDASTNGTEPDLLSAAGYESAGPDATGPTVLETSHARDESSILPPPFENGKIAHA